MDGFESKKCPFCKEEIKQNCSYSKLSAKGVGSILAAVSVDELVRNDCRKKYVHKREIIKSKNLNEIDDAKPGKNGVVRRRSTEIQFSFTANCFLCTSTCDSNDTKNSVASTLELKTTVLTTCDQRSDKWSDDVRARLQCINDLPAAGAIYHRQCFRNFKSNLSIPKCHSLEPDLKKKQSWSSGR